MVCWCRLDSEVISAHTHRTSQNDFTLNLSQLADVVVFVDVRNRSAIVGCRRERGTVSTQELTPHILPFLSRTWILPMMAYTLSIWQVSLAFTAVKFMLIPT